MRTTSVYTDVMPRLIELAVLGWCAEQNMSADDARALRAETSRVACACVGPPIPVAGLPCMCELRAICVAIALGEDPCPPMYRGQAGMVSWKAWLEKIYAEAPESAADRVARRGPLP